MLHPILQSISIINVILKILRSNALKKTMLIERASVRLLLQGTLCLACYPVNGSSFLCATICESGLPGSALGSARVQIKQFYTAYGAAFN